MGAVSVRRTLLVEPRFYQAPSDPAAGPIPAGVHIVRGDSPGGALKTAGAKPVIPVPDNLAVGTVSDQARGLMWQQADDGAKKTWEQALAYCEGLILGGFGDWRLPTVKDLTSIEDFSRYPVGDPTFFPTAKPSDYWSSTTVQSAPTTAWQASFLDGRVGPGLDKTTAAAYVRCVRGQ